MGNVLGNFCMFKMLVTSAAQQSENDLKWPLTEYQTSQKKCSFIPSASASFNTCSNEFCFPFCFHMCPLHTAVLPDHHGVDPLKAFVGTQCQSGRTSWVNDREWWQIHLWEGPEMRFLCRELASDCVEIESLYWSACVFQLEAFQTTSLLLIPFRGV